jgi:hypothetical protein
VLADETTHGHKKLYELPYLEIARQMTLMDSQFFERVSPHQMLMLGISTFEEQCSEWYKYSTHVTRVIVSYILNGSTAEERLKYTIKFIKVARQIFEFNNFVGFKTVMDALCSKYIHPFVKQKEKDIKVDYALLEKRYKQIVENEGREHLELLENLYPPIIPYLIPYGFLLRNLYESSGPVPLNLIDVQKWQNASIIIAEPINYQRMGFNFLPMKFIQDRLLDAPSIITDDDELKTKNEILIAEK